MTVVGVGGAGCNAVNNMIAAGLTGVEYVVANTDAQALAASSAEHRVQLGVNLTEGLGAGAKPEIGQAAAEEAMDELRAQVSGSHMVFLAAGMGGGTGTGAASVIARIAREQGILVVGVVTKPFQFEGSRRMRIAEAGIEELKQCVDTLIVIPNQNLFLIANEKTTFSEAFVLADHVLYSGVACIVDLILKEGLINLDFADVRSVMAGMGTAMMGTGEASGERRATLAAEEAISNPLLDDISLQGAKGLLLSITGGPDLTLYEVDEAASRVRQEVDADATIIVGATFDETLTDKIRVSIVASGMGRNSEKSGSGFMGLQNPGRVVPPPPPPAGSQPVHEQSPPSEQGLHGEEAGLSNENEGRSTLNQKQPPELDAGQNFESAPQFGAAPGQDGGELLEERLTGAIQTDASSAPNHDPSMAGVWEEDRHSSSYNNEGVGQAFEPLAPNEQGHPGVDNYSNDDAGAGARQDLEAPSEGGVQWQGPGDVLIEEGFSPSVRTSEEYPISNTQPDGGMDQNYPYESAQFQPQQPPGNVRRPERRPLQVEDFPAVGQREYNARVGSNGEDSVQPEHVGTMLQKAQAQRPVRKKGLFERLTGFTKKQSDSFSEPESNPAFDPNYQDSNARQQRDGRGQGPDQGAPRGGSKGQEASELPVFFSNQRRR